MITHVFDSSAVLAHFFKEPGAEIANSLLTDAHAQVGITAVSLLEFRRTILRSLGDAPTPVRLEAEEAIRLYSEELLETVAVTRPLSEEAARLMSEGCTGLTEAQALSVAAAKINSAILVHRAPAFESAPLKSVRVIKL